MTCTPLCSRILRGELQSVPPEDQMSDLSLQGRLSPVCTCIGGTGSSVATGHAAPSMAMLNSIMAPNMDVRPYLYPRFVLFDVYWLRVVASATQKDVWESFSYPWRLELLRSPNLNGLEPPLPPPMYCRYALICFDMLCGSYPGKADYDETATLTKN